MTEWTVEQGPRWLAELMYGPPWWMWWLLGATGVAAALLTGYVLHRDGIDEEIQAEILSNGLTTSAVVIGTLISINQFTLGYLGDILVGIGVGLGMAVYAPTASRQFIEEITDPDATEQAAD